MNLLGWVIVFFGSLAVSFVLGRASDYQRARWVLRPSAAVAVAGLTLLEVAVAATSVGLAFVTSGSFILAGITGLFTLGVFDLRSLVRNLRAFGPASTYLLNRFRPSN